MGTVTLIVGLLAVGWVVGVYSTALGAGGAFLLTPLLLIRYPDTPPEYIATAGLAIVAVSSGLNALQSLRTGRTTGASSGCSRRSWCRRRRRERR